MDPIHDRNHPRANAERSGATQGAAAQEAKQAVGRLAHEAREQVGARAADQKQRAAAGLGGVADALRRTGQTLRDEDGGAIPEYVERAAAQVERLQSYLESRDVRDLVAGVERFARREPALFLGGAFALGLVAGRLLKSTSRREHEGDLELRDDDDRAMRRYEHEYSQRYGRDEDRTGAEMAYRTYDMDEGSRYRRVEERAAGYGASAGSSMGGAMSGGGGSSSTTTGSTTSGAPRSGSSSTTFGGSPAVTGGAGASTVGALRTATASEASKAAPASTTTSSPQTGTTDPASGPGKTGGTGT